MLYNTPLEFCRRILDLYLILGDQIIIELLLSLLRDQSERILRCHNFEVLIRMTKTLMKDYLQKFDQIQWQIPLPYFDIEMIKEDENM